MAGAESNEGDGSGDGAESDCEVRDSVLVSSEAGADSEVEAGAESNEEDSSGDGAESDCEVRDIALISSEAGAGSNDEELSEDGAIKNLWMNFQLKIKT